MNKTSFSLTALAVFAAIVTVGTFIASPRPHRVRGVGMIMNREANAD